MKFDFMGIFCLLEILPVKKTSLSLVACKFFNQKPFYQQKEIKTERMKA